MAAVLRSWRLFWLLVAGISIANIFGLPGVDFSSDRSVETLILRTILVALPCLITAFMASSLLQLWPGRTTRWLVVNRRYIGLAFAAGMAWHFAFVGYFFSAFGYRLEPQDITLDVIGVLFLLAMTVTSFPKFRGKLSPANWRRLHKAGIYTLWFLPSFFFLEDFVRERDLFDGAALGFLLAVLMVRTAAWALHRRPAPA
jgi:methionine sulfoxide reductase heme-binding subunit